MPQSPPTVNPNFLKEEGNIRIAQLDSIILLKNGKPDRLAIDIYIEARSWFKPKKEKDDSGNVILIPKLKGEGWRTSYSYLSKKFNCTKDWTRKKLILLEELGLLTREFRDECINGELHNNRLYILVWKNTPYFTSNIGSEKPIIDHPPLILESESLPCCSMPPSNTVVCPPLILESDPIYSNTNNITNNNTNRSISTKIYNRDFEKDDDSVGEREGRVATIEEFEATPQTTTNEFTPKYLRDVKLTSVLLDELRVRSGTDFTNDRIIAIIRNIRNYKPDTQIFGGRNGLINYLTKVLKGEQEYEEQYTTPDDEDAKSIEDRIRKQWEESRHRFENGVITWLD